MKKILVIDDNMLMRKLIVNIFDKRNYCIDEADNGSDGLNSVIKNNYDLVITDILMPGMDGIEMIRYAKKINTSLKIIAITGGDPVYLSIAKKFGADSVLTKPLNYNTFKNTAEEILNLQRKLKNVG